MHVGHMQFQLAAIRIEQRVDVVHLLAEVIVHTFHDDHGLTAVIDSQCLVLHTLGGDLYLRQIPDLSQYGVIGRSRLALDRSNLQLRIEIGKQVTHQIAEPIEHTQRDHQCHRGDSDAKDGDATDDIDDIGALLREQVAPGYKKRDPSPAPP